MIVTVETGPGALTVDISRLRAIPASGSSRYAVTGRVKRK
jgi:hypothetical protein